MEAAEKKDAAKEAFDKAMAEVGEALKIDAVNELQDRVETINVTLRALAKARAAAWEACEKAMAEAWEAYCEVMAAALKKIKNESQVKCETGQATSSGYIEGGCLGARDKMLADHEK